MQKIDFKRELQQLYRPSAKSFSVVDVPAMQFLMSDGHGDPNTSQGYADAVAALYAVSYKLKFMSKKSLEKDYTVPPLEGLWWAADMDTFTVTRDKSQWDWTMMIMQPDWITADLFDQALAIVQKQKALPALHTLRLQTVHEGLCVQIMHIGSYEDEGPILAQLHDEFIPARGFERRGKHHEIYLSDPRRVAPEKLKTVLRQPVQKRAHT